MITQDLAQSLGRNLVSGQTSSYMVFLWVVLVVLAAAMFILESTFKGWFTYITKEHIFSLTCSGITKCHTYNLGFTESTLRLLSPLQYNLYNQYL